MKPSPALAAALFLTHGGAIACALVYLPGWVAPAIATTAIAVSLAFHLCRSALLVSAKAVLGLTLTDRAQCTLLLRNGETFTGIVEPSTFVALLLIVINVREPIRNARRSAILLPDSAAAQDLRALRVWLRHRTHPHPPGSGPL